MTQPAPITRPAHGAAMLTILLSAWFMAQFDFFVVNVAAPSFQAHLHAGPASLELIVGGYAFTYAAGMVTGGRLGDQLGHRRMFVTGMAAFTVASLLCGIATSPGELIAARLIQGLAGAMMVPQVLALITVSFTGHERARALGWYGAAGGIGAIAGQVFGGLLLDLNVVGLGWRVVFLINVPVGLVAGVVAVRLLPAATPRRRTRQDPLGACGIAAALALVLVPLALGRTAGWPLWTWLCLAASLPIGILALRWERRLTRRGGNPVLDMSLFRIPSYVAGVGAVVAHMTYFAAFMFTLTLLLQHGMGLSPFQAGLTFAPMGVMFSATALWSSRLVRRYGLGVLIVGCVMVATALVLFVIRLASAGAHTGVPWTVASVALLGAGNGLVIPQVIAAATVEVAPEHAGSGAGVLTTAQQFAGSVGVAVLGTVFFATAGVPGSPASFAHAMRRSTLIDVGLITLAGLLVATIMIAARRDR